MKAFIELILLASNGMGTGFSLGFSMDLFEAISMSFESLMLIVTEI